MGKWSVGWWRTHHAIDKSKRTTIKAHLFDCPDHLKNASSALAKDLGHGKGYLYPHDYSGSFVSQEYLPKELSGTMLWKASGNLKEQQLSAQQQALWKEKYEN